jgi:hypothetical protein
MAADDIADPATLIRRSALRRLGVRRSKTASQARMLDGH